MGGQPTQTTDTSQQSTTQPWAAAQPALMGLLGKLGGIDTSVTPAQSAAAGALGDAAAGLPNFAPQLTATADTLLGGGPDYKSLVSGAYGNLQGQLAPYLGASYLDPRSTPGLSDALASLGNDISSQVNGQFAAAGRDLSPANTAALARGLSQGEGALLANQYNANVGTQLNAANTLFNAGNTSAGSLSNLSQAALGNELSGANLAGQLPSLLTQPAQTALAAANAAQALPLQDLGAYQSLLAPLAALGSQTSSTGTQTATQTVPLGQQIAGGVIGGAGLLGKLGAFGPAGWLFGA